MGELSLSATDWFDPETSTFGDRVTGAREAAGFGQAELAKRLGVKVKTVRGWENDQSEPRANKLGMLAGLLGVSIVWLLTGKGQGVESPEEVQTLGDDLEAVLRDLRQLRLDQAEMTERMARMEKRLRAALAS